MGVVIQVDFKKHAADRDAARRAKEKPVADISNLYPPHTWPAGPADDEPQIATIMSLEGAFRDSALYAAIPQANDHYSLLQFAPDATPDTLKDAKPIGRFYVPAAVMHEQFAPMDRKADAKLGQHFARMALLGDNPGQEAQLYNLVVTGVHLVIDTGLYAFGNGQIAELYHAGEAVVEYKGGSVAHGPASAMLARLKPVDDDARISLASAPDHIVKPRNDGPGFNF